MNLMRRIFPVALLLIAVATTAAAQPQGPGPGGRGGQGPLPGGRGGRFGGIPPRDNTQTPTGTAKISGRVIAADTGTPIRRAQININSRDAQFNRSVTTDSEGRYELAALPAGRYRLFVNKAGYRARSSTARRARSRRASRSTSQPGRYSRRSISACLAAAPLPDASPTSSAIRLPTCRCRRCAINSSTESGSSSTPGGRHRRTTLARTAFSGSCRATTSSVRRRVRTCRRDRVARKQSQPDIPARTIPASPTSARPRRSRLRSARS